MDKEVSLRTLAAQNAQRKRKLGDIKEIIGQVNSQYPNIVHRAHFTFIDGEFEHLYCMIFAGKIA